MFLHSDGVLMCSHSEHRYEVLPDGQVAEEHYFTEQDLERLQEAINRTMGRMLLAAYTMSTAGEVTVNGKSWADSEGEFSPQEQA